MMQQFGIIGYPLSHSFSPAYFQEKFKALGLLDYSYKAFPLENISQLQASILEHKLRGFNVTIPYKESILPYLDLQSDVVQKIGACNCVAIKNQQLYGYNTDVIGFEQSLLPLLQQHHQKALILGTGGAAKAVAYILQKNNINASFVSRTKKNNCLSYAEINATTLHTHPLIINTTPLGMSPHTDACPPLLYECLTEQHLCYDLIYNPEETLFLQKAKQQKATIKNGYEMLLLQADESWKIWLQHSF